MTFSIGWLAVGSSAETTGPVWSRSLGISRGAFRNWSWAGWLHIIETRRRIWDYRVIGFHGGCARTMRGDGCLVFEPEVNGNI